MIPDFSSHVSCTYWLSPCLLCTISSSSLESFQILVGKFIVSLKSQATTSGQIILPPEGCHVQPREGIDDGLTTPSVRAITVIHLPILPDATELLPTTNENRVARLLTCGEVRLSRGLHLGLSLPIVRHGRDTLVLRDVEIVIEGAFGRRDPGERPAHAFLVRRDLLDRGATHSHKARRAAVERPQVWYRVAEHRTARTPGLPVRPEHEVVDNELGAAREEILQRDRVPGFSSEGVGLCDLDNGQSAPFLCERVPCARIFFF